MIWATALVLVFAWYFQHLSKKKENKQFSYGYKRFSLLGAIVNSLVLVVSSVFIITEAIPRIIEPQEVEATGMIYLAILGIIVNGVAAWRLHSGKSLNEQVVSLHLLEDVLGWVAVLIASVVMLYKDIPELDPILSLLIACWVLVNVYRNIKKSFKIILQGTPENIDIEQVKSLLQSMPEVHSLHNCHLWSMDGNYNVFTVHLVLNETKTLNELALLKRQARELIKDFPIHHTTIEIETQEESHDPPIE